MHLDGEVSGAASVWQGNPFLSLFLSVFTFLSLITRETGVAFLFFIRLREAKLFSERKSKRVIR